MAIVLSFPVVLTETYTSCFLHRNANFTSETVVLDSGVLCSDKLHAHNRYIHVHIIILNHNFCTHSFTVYIIERWPHLYIQGYRERATFFINTRKRFFFSNRNREWFLFLPCQLSMDRSHRTNLGEGGRGGISRGAEWRKFELCGSFQ